MEEKPNGYLLIIGGAEDKTGGSAILKETARFLGNADTLTILTTATEKPEEAGRRYLRIFHELGVQNTQALDISTRDDANSDRNANRLKLSKCVFMTGGDQLRITSILGGTKACRALKEQYASGGMIIGTSAGASAMSATMIISGTDNEPAKKCTLKMAPGLGLVSGVIIDQHFDQRGRFGRLLCGVAQNPDELGIGIDEDTAVKLFPDMHFEVIGTNAVTVLDGSTILSTNVSELQPNDILAAAGVSVSVLPAGYGLDLKNRKVLRLQKNEV